MKKKNYLKPKRIAKKKQCASCSDFCAVDGQTGHYASHKRLTLPTIISTLSRCVQRESEVLRATFKLDRHRLGWIARRRLMLLVKALHVVALSS